MPNTAILRAVKLRIAIAVVVTLLIAVNAPKRAWLFYMEHRLHTIEARAEVCSDSLCQQVASRDLDQFHEDITHPPLWVFGAGQ